MSDIVISVDNVSKLYQLGTIGSGTFRGDVRRWWAKTRGLPNPDMKIGERDSANRNGEYIWALKDVNFQVRQGEALGIIGRNGAGKSTLFKILSRVTAPTSGLLKAKGRIASLLEVGTGFHAELTGRENIFLNGAILGMRRAEILRKMDEIVSFSGVEQYIDTPVKRYSSGMYVRLAFAVGAHLDPDILVVDEVLAVGDAEFQKKCLGKMTDSTYEGRTVLFVSHNMTAIQRLCNRAILLSHGTITADGEVSSIVEQYLSTGIAQKGERLWGDISQAPGDEVVRLIAARSLNAGGDVSSDFSVLEPFYLEVEFQVLQGGHPLDVAFYLYNSRDDVVFTTSDFSSPVWQGKPRPTGRYRTRCEVPGNLLNDGQLRILVAVSTNPSILRAIDDNALTIEIKDSFEVAGARGNYTREWPGGSVRPLLKWNTVYSND